MGGERERYFGRSAVLVWKAMLLASDLPLADVALIFSASISHSLIPVHRTVHCRLVAGVFVTCAPETVNFLLFLYFPHGIIIIIIIMEHT